MLKDLNKFEDFKNFIFKNEPDLHKFYTDWIVDEKIYRFKSK